jgi:hypothetical protein
VRSGRMRTKKIVADSQAFRLRNTFSWKNPAMSLFCPTIVAAILAANTTAGMAQERAANASAATAEKQVTAKPSPCQAIIDRAMAANRYVFIFFWKEEDSQTKKAWSVLQPAVANMADSAEAASIRITNPAEKQVINKYDVSRAPMPLVLAVAPCGAITKAFAKTFDEEQLRTAFVSPCEQSCLKALQSRKLVLVCVTAPSNPNEPATLPKAVKDFKADPKYGSATEIVLINAKDKDEAKFLKEIDVGELAELPATVFLAPPRAMIGRFGPAATKDAFVAKLVAAQSNPCGGGKCGPGGCPPK